MKKTYIAPSSIEFAMTTEGNLLNNSLGIYETGDTGASEALTRGHMGWNQEMWATGNEEEE